MPFGIATIATIVIVTAGGSSPGWGVLITLVQQLAMGLGVAWWVRQHDGSIAPLGLRRGGTTLRDVGAGVAAGLGAIVASAVTIGITMQLLGRTEIPNPLEAFGEEWVVPNAILALLLAPICEEILCRGLWFGGLRQRLRFGWSALISGALFGLIHGDAVRFASLAVTGVILAAVYERRRTLGASIAAHATVNVLALVGLLANL
jgi:membrane protease YdiL (CAAX protease family)